MNQDILSTLELSTQALVAEARRRGVDVELIDADDNLIRLSAGGRTEYVKQATRTSADTYISALLMENKEATKRLLREAGLSVPAGYVVHSIKEAAPLWETFRGRGLVVKPRSTNFGEGVAIFRDESWRTGGPAALEQALKLDSAALIEEFVAGPEYRFLIIDNKTIAVLHRVPANVTGDGHTDIQGLVARKNEDPRRGSGYVKPLEKLRLGETEAAFLSAQGLSFESVPAEGQLIYLRENSNISTGGDSLDFTDEVHPDYKAIAVAAARAVGAKICGADIIIPDIHRKPGAHDYGIIELNFNPALHIHNHPFRGLNRHVEGPVLDLLGFPLREPVAL